MNESIFVLSSMAVFAVIGMLTGYLHGHGEDAGAACGGLAGFILSIIVPAMLGTSFMSKQRTLQCCAALAALVLLVAIICVMYDHAIKDMFFR